MASKYKRLKPKAEKPVPVPEEFKVTGGGEGKEKQREYLQDLVEKTKEEMRAQPFPETEEEALEVLAPHEKMYTEKHAAVYDGLEKGAVNDIAERNRLIREGELKLSQEEERADEYEQSVRQLTEALAENPVALANFVRHAQEAAAHTLTKFEVGDEQGKIEAFLKGSNKRILYSMEEPSTEIENRMLPSLFLENGIPIPEDSRGEMRGTIKNIAKTAEQDMAQYAEGNVVAEFSKAGLSELIENGEIDVRPGDLETVRAFIKNVQRSMLYRGEKKVARNAPPVENLAEIKDLDEESQRRFDVLSGYAEVVAEMEGLFARQEHEGKQVDRITEVERDMEDKTLYYQKKKQGVNERRQLAQAKRKLNGL